MEIDRDLEIDPYSPVCDHCKHLLDFGMDRHCRAFPEKQGIPLEIWEGINSHRVAYPGDQGIQFEPIQ